ncbi:MAG TPA: hypothetical protein VG847_12445 [Chitinophagaceae bacterium]|nr:hypothetical protein [Chitinophagaceae bacterium]
MKRIYFILLVLAFCRAEIYSQTPKQLLAAGDSFYFNQNWKAAAAEYEKAFAGGEPPTALYASRLGFSYLNLRNYDAAIKNLELSLQKHPAAFAYPAIYSRLAKAYAGTGNKQQAFEKLDSAEARGYINFPELDSSREFDKYRNDDTFKILYEKAYQGAFPCMINPHQREFDFWIGEWDVYQTGSNQLVGRSVIQLGSGGCFILENWTAIGLPNTGKSMNFVDPATNKWKQVWVGSGGTVTEYVNGVFKDSVMQFESTMQTPQGAAQVRFRFFNQGPDQVRQFQEFSNDEGKTWKVAYDLTYIRRKK